jgi:leucyl/phenylalanyl-tRNA--protein transferase
VESYFEGDLVGGLYGVAIGGFFAGESMFFKRSDASKLALWWLVDHLKSLDVSWIDCQMVTPLFRAFGAVEVPRERYTEMLMGVLDRDITLFPRKEC